MTDNNENSTLLNEFDDSLLSARSNYESRRGSLVGGPFLDDNDLDLYTTKQAWEKSLTPVVENIDRSSMPVANTTRRRSSTPSLSSSSSSSSSSTSSSSEENLVETRRLRRSSDSNGLPVLMLPPRAPVDAASSKRRSENFSDTSLSPASSSSSLSISPPNSQIRLLRRFSSLRGDSTVVESSKIRRTSTARSIFTETAPLPIISKSYETANTNSSTINDDTISIRIPDGRVATRRFSLTVRVDDVIRIFYQQFEITTPPIDQFCLCMFDVDSPSLSSSASLRARPCSFPSNLRVLGDIEEIRTATSRRSVVSMALLHNKRINSAWNCALIARCIGNAAAWLVDTPEICAFVSSSNAVLSSSIIDSGSTVDSLSSIGDLPASNNNSNNSSQRSSFGESIRSRTLQRTLSTGDSEFLRTSPTLAVRGLSEPNEIPTTLPSRRCQSELSHSSVSTVVALQVVSLDVHAQLRTELRASELFVRIDLRYRDQSLLVEQLDDSSQIGGGDGRQTIARSASDTTRIVWNERVVFDVPLADVPRETYFDIRLYVRQASTSSSSLSPTRSTSHHYNVIVGHALFSLFDHRDFLRSGIHNISLWPGEPPTLPRIRSFCDDVASRLPLLLTVQFDALERPIRYRRRRVRNVTLYKLSNLSERTRTELCNIIAKPNPLDLTPNERRLVWQHWRALTDDARALPHVLQAMPRDVVWLDQIHSVLNHWTAPERASDVILLLGAQIVDTRVRSWAVACLERLNVDELLASLSQLVQALKSEMYHDSALMRFLVRHASSDRRVGQRLYWFAFVEMQIDLQHATRFGLLLEAYLCNDLNACAMFLRQRELVVSLNSIAQRVQSFLTHVERTTALKHELADLARRRITSSETPCDCPFDPRIKLGTLLVNRCKVMNSKKCPLWLTFETVTNDNNGEIDTCTLLFKSGDDLRQDMLVLNAIRLMDSIWQSNNLDMRMTLYECVPTGVDCGMIEAVTPATTTAKITASHGGMLSAMRTKPLLLWLNERATEQRAQLPDIVENFTRSCAGYSVAMFILGVGDRHNDNVLLQHNGRLFHVDFGHCFGKFKQKYGVKRETAPFVMTKDFQYVIENGAANDVERSAKWNAFVALGATAFAALRRNTHSFVSMFQTTLPASLPTLTKQADVNYTATTLLSDNDSVDKVWSELVSRSLETKRTVLNNMVHIAVRHGVSATSSSSSMLMSRSSVQDVLQQMQQFELTHDGGSFDVVVNVSNEKSNSIVGLLNRLTDSNDVQIHQLSLNNLRCWNVDCSRALMMLLCQTTVVKLDISGTKLTADINNYAVSISSLMDIDVSRCGLTEQHIVRFLSWMPSLKRLLLCQNRLDDRCVWSLIELLANTATNLQHIDISGNDFSAVGLASLTEAALSCYNLRSFILCDEMTNVQSTIESRAIFYDENVKLTSIASLTDALVKRRSTLKNDDKSTLDLSEVGCFRVVGEGMRRFLPTLFCIEWHSLRMLAICNVGLVSLLPLADALARCTSLESLSLARNEIIELDHNLIAQLGISCPIQSLDLSFNRLTTLPLSLRELTRLVRLNLRANRIESIPFVFHSVVALQSLDLSSNALSEWPLALDATLLRSCRALMLANNKISLVPSLLLGELPRLEYISLHHNPLTNYTASSTFDSTSLLKSMRALRARTDDAPLHPVRVLILGKEKVGKTSIARLFRNSKSKVERVASIEFTVISATNRVPELRILDFNHERILYSLHSFFSSARCIFVVVVNLWQPDVNNLIYWLQQTLFSQISNTPLPRKILIAYTHIDMFASPSMAQKALTELIGESMRRFSSLLTQCVHIPLSLVSHAGVDTLLDSVNDAAIILSTDRLMSCEIAFKQLLAKQRLKSKLLTWTQYVDLAAQCYITHDALFDVTRSLHAAGSVMWFDCSASLRRIVILHPQHIIDILHSIASNTRAQLSAIVSERDITQLLPESLFGQIDDYPTLLNHCIALLEKFEILYRTRTPTMPSSSASPTISRRWTAPSSTISPSLPPKKTIDETVSSAATTTTTTPLSSPIRWSDRRAGGWWLLPFLPAARSMTSFPPVDSSSIEARWRRVWQFDAHAAPANLMTRLLAMAMNLNTSLTVLSMWHNGIEFSLTCIEALPLLSDRSQRRRLQQFFVSLTFDIDSSERTIVLDTFCCSTSETILSPTLQQRRRSKESNVLLREKTTTSNVRNDASLLLLPTSQQLLSQLVQLIQRSLVNNDIAAQRLICCNCTNCKGATNFTLQECHQAIRTEFSNVATNQTNNNNEEEVLVAAPLMCHSMPVKIEMIAPELVLQNVCTLIEFDELEFAEIELGRGAFSVVRRGEHGGAVAIKSLTVSNNVTSVDESANDVSMYDEFCCEATIMSSMHHRNIVRLHGVVLSASTLSLVMELCEGGTLDTFLQKSTVANVSWSLVRIIALDVARALEYMHELQSPVVHRDIRSSNVFLTLPGVDLLKKYTQRQSNNDLIVAKVGDFGLARYLTPNVTESLESWSWMAPETRGIGRAVCYDDRVDVYSFAMLLYHLLSHRSPFSEYEDRDAFSLQTAIVYRDLRPSLSKQLVNIDIPASFLELVRSCWQTDPALRPSMKVVVQRLATV